MFLKSVAVLFILCGFASCGDGEKKTVDSLSSCKTKSLNPNGDSELAILMREMVAITDSIKSDLSSHRNIRNMPENLAAILTAKKTDETIDKAIYIPLANNYLDRVKDFYSSTGDAQIHAYNLMVSACVSCHQNFCGGPIKRINRLHLEEL